VLSEDVSETPPGHAVPAGVEKELRSFHVGPHGKPRSKCGTGFVVQRESTLPSALSAHEDAGGRLQGHIADQKADELRCTEPRRKRKMQHCPVTDASVRAGIRRVEEGLQLVLLQVGNQARVRLLDGDGENSADLLESRR
jgi:hypothetical protein